MNAELVTEPFAPHVHSLEGAELMFVVRVEGREWTVVIPLSRVQIAFEKEARRMGCALPRSLGAARTVGGWFSSVKNVWKKATRKVKKALPKVARRAVSRVERVANRGAKLAMRGYKVAKDVAKSDAFAYALTAAAVAVPALAPAAGAVMAARTIMNNIDKGVKAAKQLERGISNPTINRALKTAWNTRGAAQQLVNQARRGNRGAMGIMGALRQLAPAAVYQRR